MKNKKMPAAKESMHLSDQPLFDKENFTWMFAGAIVIVIGYLLMAGGRSDNPNVFDKTQVYSTMRITIAPIVVLIGFVIEIFAIFHQPKKRHL